MNHILDVGTSLATPCSTGKSVDRN